MIQCPSNQVAVSTDGTAVKPTYSSQPSYVDNSEIDWFHLWCDPDIDYHEFEVGEWEVTCGVEDLNGNEAECTFTVRVVTGKSGKRLHSSFRRMQDMWGILLHCLE